MIKEEQQMYEWCKNKLCFRASDYIGRKVIYKGEEARIETATVIYNWTYPNEKIRPALMFKITNVDKPVPAYDCEKP